MAPAHTHALHSLGGGMAGREQRERRERERYFKELVYMIMEAWQAPNP